jgi:hypothetical protein
MGMLMTLQRSGGQPIVYRYVPKRRAVMQGLVNHGALGMNANGATSRHERPSL